MNDRIVFNWVEATTSNRECCFTLYSELKAKSLTAGELGDVFFSCYGEFKSFQS